MELSCHGGLHAPARLLAALHAAGARPAAPGEFTRRAVLNGKLDLVQAEAVGDLIDATAPAQARAALRAARGRPVASTRGAPGRAGRAPGAAELRDRLPRAKTKGRCRRRGSPRSSKTVREPDQHLLATAPSAERLREGRPAGFAGRPNAGKSSLLQRAAGLRSGAGHRGPRHHPRYHRGAHRLSGLARAAGRHGRTLGGASRAGGPARRGSQPAIPGRGGSGAALRRSGPALGDDETPSERAAHASGPDQGGSAHRAGRTGLPVSVVTGQGLGVLRRAAAERVFGDRIALADLEPALTRERHRVALAGPRRRWRAPAPPGRRR